MRESTILIVSPIPSHPQFQGNSARIYRLNRLWQQAGFKVHFLYFGMEGISPESEVAMREAWDNFVFLAPIGPAAKPSLGEEYAIDDWFDDRLGAKVTELCSIFDYSHVLVNYVWMSKVLDYVPKSSTKIIDTHDRFANRNARAMQQGVDANWFSTTEEEERYGLERADLVFAITEEEQKAFETTVTVPVCCIGHVLPKQSILDCTRGGRITIGYFGSDNPYNVSSLHKLIHGINTYSLAHAADNAAVFNAKLKLVIAGSICSRVTDDTASTGDLEIELLGRIDNLSTLVRRVDFLVNPMSGGTGLKIKTLDFLSYGKPMLATADAMVGISDADAGANQEMELSQMISLLCESGVTSLKTMASLEQGRLRACYNERHLSNFQQQINNK